MNIYLNLFKVYMYRPIAVAAAAGVAHKYCDHLCLANQPAPAAGRPRAIIIIVWCEACDHN